MRPLCPSPQGPLDIGAASANTGFQKGNENMPKTNREGMTFAEWRGAANAHRVKPLPERIAVGAWKRGEDPTEYADRG